MMVLFHRVALRTEHSSPAKVAAISLALLLMLLLVPDVVEGFTIGRVKALAQPNTLLHQGHDTVRKPPFYLHSAVKTGDTPLQTWIPEEVIQTDYVICGGGPAGLLSAIMLAQKFPENKIKLFDRLSPPPDPSDVETWGDVARFYLIGLGSRGQDALKKFGVWEEVEANSVATVGRKDWAPDADEGVERIFTDRKVQTQVLPRDKLVSVLNKHIRENYADRIELNHGYEIQPLDFGTESGGPVFVRASKCGEGVARLTASEEKTAAEQQEDVLCDPSLGSSVFSADLLLAADGTVRTIANAIQEKDEKRFRSMNPIKRLFAGSPFKVKRFPDDNRRIYKTIPIKVPSDWRGDLNYSARSKGSRIVYDALPANKNGDYCGVLLLREDDPLAKPNSNPSELRKALDEFLPQFSAIIDDETLAKVAQKPPSYLPSFRYVGPRLHEGNKTLILGDCAHTVKPYFGLGANSALEDVKILSNIIDETSSLVDAVHTFSERRAIESKKLVTISRELDRPGALGFLVFVLPIILDAVFHKMFPKIFSPNTITMLQREDLSFQQVARKKRLDRIGQIAILVGGFSAFAAGTKFALISLAKATGKRLSTVTGGAVGCIFTVVLLKKLLPFLVPGLAPADIMTRTSKGKA